MLPYLKIFGYETLPNFTAESWKNALQLLFFTNNLPQMWIIDTIIYSCPQKNSHIIVYVYLISHFVKKFVHAKLSKYLSCNDIVRLT